MCDEPRVCQRPLTCPGCLQGSTEGSAIKDFVVKHTLPLVGHRKPSNEAKRYSRRPLVVVYYSVDFSFDYRAGEGPMRVGGQSRVFSVASGSLSFCAPGRQGLMALGTGLLGGLGFRPRAPAHTGGFSAGPCQSLRDRFLAPSRGLTALRPVAATQFWRSKVLEVAKDFPEYTFAVADEDDFATEVKDLGLSESGEDVNAAVLDEGGRKFAMEPDEFDSDALREFVTAFKRGGLRGVGGWEAAGGAPGVLAAAVSASSFRSLVPSLILELSRDLWEGGDRVSLFFCLFSLFFFFFLL